MKSDFFNRPLWQQYTIGFVTIITMIIISYLFFIEDIANQAKQQFKQHQIQSEKIKQLQTQIDRYQTQMNRSFILLSEKDLAHAITQNQLTLHAFRYYRTDNKTMWDIELHGQFANFLNLLSTFNHNSYYLDLSNFRILRQNTYLIISFTLSFDKETT
ncbi:hypothetical protein J3U35_06915 [Gilliamella sp. B2717]|uniref:hypothetical protein n=1 Tax=Gilliamella sp. B2717 TaxID=2817996 RepID=UPI002269AA7B|nr:hypothetical protein [Gilliamella sp. B2717]MCX8579168.1 hypothetical protein [Gilliamella sp. B2717]